MFSNNEIQNELIELNSSLSSLAKNEMTYVVPENYFKDFSCNLSASIAVTNIIEEQSNNPYAVPPHYFAAFPEKIKQKIAEETYHTPSLFQLYPYWKPLQVAAVIVFLVFGGFNLLNAPKEQVSYHQQLNNLSENEVRAYILQTGGDFDNQEITASSSISFNKISEQEIKQYLDEQGWQ
jgi:predicted house-cleaning NTP pyrophosphatase (Maf/HAM1 superfamily)